jgi:nitrate/nitrite-specific signal transduction histidine kinase
VVIDLHYETSPAPAVSPAGAPQGSQIKSTELRIRDDGHGFDTAKITTAGHYGLSMMRERAESVGAQLNFTSRPDQGTKITLRWPGTSKQEA